eukprot:360964-Chlamydomonas_euryale.AAC.2
MDKKASIVQAPVPRKRHQTSAPPPQNQTSLSTKSVVILAWACLAGVPHHWEKDVQTGAHAPLCWRHAARSWICSAAVRIVNVSNSGFHATLPYPPLTALTTGAGRLWQRSPRSSRREPI